ncbi:MAG: prepilin-type N-terminal cleavage/methylation domain-containing protein [Peptococcaceae bacterium]|nr:prepilin-type N-terminal cleavage/methylation domain-containing protein [Peptococcaceae bacterium]
MKKRRIVLNRGFTLVELVVVMSIISIIIVIAVPLYKNYIGETVYRV